MTKIGVGIHSRPSGMSSSDGRDPLVYHLRNRLVFEGFDEEGDMYILFRVLTSKRAETFWVMERRAASLGFLSTLSWNRSISYGSKSIVDSCSPGSSWTPTCSD